METILILLDFKRIIWTWNSNVDRVGNIFCTLSDTIIITIESLMTAYVIDEWIGFWRVQEVK